MTTEIWQLSESELLADAAAVSHQIQLLEARRIALVAEIDTRVSREKLGVPGPAGWLTSTTLLSPSKATKIVALARGMAAFPDIADAVNTGVMTIDHAALILAFAETPPEHLPQKGRDAARAALIKAATGPDARTGRIRAAITRLEDSFGTKKPPAENPDRNELFASKILNGRLVLQGDFDAITGEKLLTALSPLTEPHPAADGTQDQRSPAKRRADAFGHILDHYLASSDRPIEGGERPHLNLHIRLQDLTDLQNCGGEDDITDDETSRAATESETDTVDLVDIITGNPVDTDAETEPDNENGSGSGSGSGSGDHGEGGAADRGAYRDLFGDGASVGWLPWMGPLSRNTSRQLACDCVLTAIVMDENGNPLNLARTARTVTAKQRRALTARDHGCAFPGCGKPAAWTEGHHIWHWGDGGPTDMNNLVLLCGFHHRLIHHSDWEVFIGTDNHPWFVPPATVDPYRQPRPSHARAGPHIA
ncbi:MULTISPECIES: HNH endonuclease signature motif containing protein [unclassified Rhodococcus (in: high G+C Gram-positive bacteria)]|uniref:HNH endonuclease signature motif containing protein n=1 Tax=unclassified Rhodococcus (in: high G+C Gram-positive bacteria) TaxID=192944 RepID=UPI000B9BB58A|nr:MULTISPECIES: HNH endonuclease signature motif containing protein [unclassified Rhodococcus (in: high G+C Gram-positive bacteria)]OZE40218.1 HNH endonuclease [Rhodococcus sp. 05-2254-4]OZE49786.1 HNH endonuclease [Rhodococcus sp. 05-2254-3]OZE50425.1 HNH endonuclease [Rhodococcus sp. 05-2254-2]